MAETNPRARWTAIGAALAALGVAAGAFGAHGLAERLDARALGQWETACRYLVYAALGVLATGVAPGAPGARRAAGLALTVGGGVFSGTVGALALGGPRWLGAITPLGGLAMIGGFAVLAWAASRS